MVHHELGLSEAGRRREVRVVSEARVYAKVTEAMRLKRRIRVYGGFDQQRSQGP